MKKLLAYILIALTPILVFAQSSETPAWADKHMITVQTNVTGSSLAWTNTVTDPWRLATVTFTLPASSTNAFSIDRVWYVRLLSKGSTVTTNTQLGSTWPGYITTNFYPIETYTYYTNALISDYTTTNVTDFTFQMGDGTGDLPIYQYLLGWDVLRFSWTITASKPVIFTGIK